MEVVTMAQTAHNLAFYARSYCDALARTPHLIDIALFNLCNAAIEFVEDGDFLGAKKALCADNHWDDDGYPVNEDGERTDADRFSMPWEV